MPDVLAELGPRLRRLRERRGITLTALAAKTEISKSTLSRLETGQRKPSLELLLPLAETYHLPLDELVGVQVVVHSEMPGHKRPGDDPAGVAALDQGQAVRLSEDFFIEARKTSPPEITIARPGGDYRASAIEEVTLAVKAQDRARAARALDELLEIPAARPEALLKKGDFLEAQTQGDAAERLFEEAAREPDQDVSLRATLRLARGAARSQNAARATTLYEEILLKAPASAHAEEARLGLAAQYRAAGRLSDARRLYEDVLRNAVPSSASQKTAEAGMKALENASAAETRP